MSKTDLPTIDPAALADVTGGTDDKVQQALDSIVSTLKDLNHNASNNGNSFLQWMPFFLLAMNGGGGSILSGGGGCCARCGRRGCHGACYRY